MADNLKDNGKAPAVIESEQKPANAVTAAGQVSFPSKKWSKTLLAVIIVLLVIVGAIVFALNRDSDKPATSTQKPLATYTTANIASYTLAGSATGNGLTFKKPAEITVFGSESDPSQRTFIHLSKSQKKTDQYVAVSRIEVSSNDYSSPTLPDSEFLSEVKKSFAQDPSSAGYKNDTQNLRQFVQEAFPEATITVKLGAAKPFTNPNIKENAWQISVTATDSSGLTPDQEGTLLWISGNKAYYRFLVIAVHPDWETDSALWQATLDSVEVNQ
jgi:hypothetical protein